jgi:hypothetical protein
VFLMFVALIWGSRHRWLAFTGLGQALLRMWLLPVAGLFAIAFLLEGVGTFLPERIPVKVIAGSTAFVAWLAMRFRAAP